MPDSNANISSYSAADLMQYATGRMSRAEMYALEKAAMEDSFLAEALEGYMEAAATQSEQVLNEQIERLNKTADKQKAKVIPLWRRKIVQLAVAACFIAGAGWFIFSLLQKSPTNTNEVAAVSKNSPKTPLNNSNSEYKMLAADSSVAYQPTIKDSAFQSPLLVAQNEEAAPKRAAAPGSFALQQTDANNYKPAGEMQKDLQKADIARADSVVATSPLSKPAMTTASLDKKEATAMGRAAQVPQHTFRAKITDANNNPLPYSNIMIEGQDFGTYSDAFGNFNFISDDTILPVRIRSVGYLNQSIALKEGKQEAKIVMQEDRQLSNNLALTVQQNNPVMKRSMKSIIERDSLTGIETINVPFYDTYLLNNNRISPLPNLNREVQISFEVTPTGEPTNITVVKSSGKALDEEAIRLIKEGPKLNQGNDTRSKRKVIVRF